MTEGPFSTQSLTTSTDSPRKPTHAPCRGRGSKTARDSSFFDKSDNAGFRSARQLK